MWAESGAFRCCAYVCVDACDIHITYNTIHVCKIMLVLIAHFQKIQIQSERMIWILGAVWSGRTVPPKLHLLFLRVKTWSVGVIFVTSSCELSFLATTLVVISMLLPCPSRSRPAQQSRLVTLLLQPFGKEPSQKQLVSF